MNNVVTLAEAFASRKQNFIENSRSRLRIVESVRQKPKEFDRPTAANRGGGSQSRLCQPYSHQHHLPAGGGGGGGGGKKHGRRQKEIGEKWEDEDNDENALNGVGKKKNNKHKSSCHATADGFCHATSGHSILRTKSQLDSLNREKKGKIASAKAGNRYHQKIAEESKRKEEEERKKEEMRKTNKIRAEVFKEKLLNHVLDKAAKKKLMGGDGGGGGGGGPRVTIKCTTCGGKKRTC